MAYRVNEVIDMTGLGRTTVYKLIGSGDLGRIKVGSSTLIPADDVKALLQRQAA
jgi:excisionase family DNA binding protein